MLKDFTDQKLEIHQICGETNIKGTKIEPSIVVTGKWIININEHEEETHFASSL